MVKHVMAHLSLFSVSFSRIPSPIAARIPIGMLYISLLFIVESPVMNIIEVVNMRTLQYVIQILLKMFKHI